MPAKIQTQQQQKIQNLLSNPIGYQNNLNSFLPPNSNSQCQIKNNIKSLLSNPETFQEGTSKAIKEFDYYLKNSYFVIYNHKTIIKGKNTTTINQKKAILGSKRGNETYRYRTLKCLSLLEKSFPLQKSHPRKYAKTQQLFLTLTTRQKEISITTARKRMTKEFTKFKKELQRKYGKIDYVKCLESHKSGYPHIHVLLFFKDKSFWTRKTGKYYFLSSKKLNKELSNIWKMGNCDIKAVFNTSESAFRYIAKYLTKTCLLQENNQNKLSIALNWVYNTKSFTSSLRSKECLDNKVPNFQTLFFFLGLEGTYFIHEFIDLVSIHAFKGVGIG